MTTHESDAAPSRRAARRGEDRDAAVVAALQQLRPHLEAAEPDPAFRLATRQRLVAMAAVRTPEPARPSFRRRLLAARAGDGPAPRWRTKATAALAGAALTVTGLATLVALAAGAGPGDALYGVKRGTEQTQLALAGDARGQVLLDLARTRLDELRGLGGNAGLADSTLATMDRQTTEGAAWFTARALDVAGTEPLDHLAGWTVEQSARLTAERGSVPPAAADDVDDSLGLLALVTARTDGLRAALACPAGPAVQGTDRLGPLPVPCPAAPEAPEAPGATGSGGSGGPATGAPEATPTPGAPQVAAPPPVPGPAAPQPTTAPPAGSTAAPAPTTPGGLLPPVTGLLPPPTVPPTPVPTSSPVLDVPLDVDACLELPLLLRLGRC